MIEGEDRLIGVGHRGCPKPLKLLHHRSGVVVGHDVGGPDRDEVPRLNLGLLRQSDGVALDDFLNEVLGHGFIGYSRLPRIGYGNSRGCVNFGFPTGQPMLVSLLLATIPQQSFSYDDLLKGFHDLTLLASVPVEGEGFRQFSSYDRASASGPGTEGWFANQDRGNYLATEVVGEETLHVLMDVEGPGCVVRFWSANPSGDLLFFVDGAEQPTMRLPMTALFDGSRAPFEEPMSAIRERGANCYVPLPFDKGLKICATADDLYYQVGVKTWAAGTRLPSLSEQLLKNHTDDIQFIGRLLDSGDLVTNPRKRTDQVGRFTPNLEQHLWVNHSGTIHLMRTRILNAKDLKDIDSVVRSLRVKIHADRDKTPQVDVPLSDFFGMGSTVKPFENYLQRVIEHEDGSLECLFLMPMPFEDGLRVKIVNESREKVFLRTQLFYELGDPQPLRLHAASHFEQGFATRPRSDFSVLDADGPGRYVGTVLSVCNLTEAWWGEGDERITLDGEEFPSVFGTGTEDYFGFAWASPNTFSHPLFGQTQCDGPGNYGHSNMHRIMIGDAIPFQKSLKFDLEIWHWENVDLDLAATSFWYAPLEGESGLPELPGPDAREARLIPERPASNSDG